MGTEVASPGALPAALLQLAEPLHLAAGELVFRMGAPANAVYRVNSGTVRLLRFGRDGEQIVLHEARSGEFFAEASLQATHYHCDAVARTACHLLRLPSDALRRLLANDAALAGWWIGLLAQELRAARSRVERLSLKGAAERVRHYLLTQSPTPQGDVVPGGTLKDLAQDLGLTHEALYRTLAAMERAGRLTRTGTRLRLL